MNKRKGTKRVRQVKGFLPGVEMKHFEALATLSNRPEMKLVYELIELKKRNIKLEHFSYPEKDPHKNALNKASSRGMVEALNFFVSSIKRAADVLDQIEEENKNG